MLEEAPEDTISVVKFTAPWCCACRASAAKMDYVAKQSSDARFYRLELKATEDGETDITMKVRVEP